MEKSGARVINTRVSDNEGPEEVGLGLLPLSLSLALNCGLGAQVLTSVKILMVKSRDKYIKNFLFPIRSAFAPASSLS